MGRKRREMDEGAGPVASAIDTFAGALGAALAMLLMLLTLSRSASQIIASAFMPRAQRPC